MALELYNTMSRKKEVFTPIAAPKVGLYCCGPTVYNYAHVGNLMSYVFADVLRRVLEYDQYEVTQVINITDVGHLTDDGDDGEDKMEKGARREGKTVWDVAEHYTEAFMKDIAALNIQQPHIWSKATAHIKEQIAQVKTLMEKGVTYTTSDGIYFDTTKIDDYGKLARLNIDEMQGGKRVDLGEKKHKTDFALWKFSPKVGPKRAMEWWFDGPKTGELADNPGEDTEHTKTIGFPGWHIECSAMSSKYLGEQFDIHTGGIDHIPVHHTNEIAQAETAFGKKPWVRVWMHNEFLVIDKGKMAKSGENFLTLPVLIERGYPALAYRYFLLSGHYRQQLQFSWEALDGAKASYERLKNIVAELKENAEEGGTTDIGFQKTFQEAIDDDLNMPKALAVLWDALRDKELSPATKLLLVADFDRVFGFELLKEEVVEIPDEIKTLAEKREKARADKDWAASDKLRDELKAKGWQINDGKDGYRLKKI